MLGTVGRVPRLSVKITRFVVAATAVALLAPAAAQAAPGAPSGGGSGNRPPWFPSAVRTAAIASDGASRDARLTIPAIGIRNMPVIAYRGTTDDAAGTVIQNRGIAAASIGPVSKGGGVGPGGIGNYLVAGHRSSHGAPFWRTPSLRRGSRIFVDAGMWRYVYRVVTTRWVDFRSPRSLRLQRAAVPGHPGERARRAWMTLSTCATPEDHARGNYWTDRLGNPQHRIDKVAVLVRRLPRH
jgi:sortase A